ncbi:MAG: prepilin-type N-terminal cleavage/methylation domain-containing protein [Oscillospiraceae bacterium]|nr:prepilin-type N-terminal cleavage/methylation domain-containing protein [Oscillospiraceae bacterium]
MLKAKMKKAKGFTLVEIIVVIAIIGVLAAVIGVAMVGYLKDARDSRASTDARSISLVTQELIFSKYAGNNVKAALSGDSENYAFVYSGNGTSDSAVL